MLADLIVSLLFRLAAVLDTGKKPVPSQPVVDSANAAADSIEAKRFCSWCGQPAGSASCRTTHD